MINPSVRAQFYFNKLGRGFLKLIIDGEDHISIASRTGSIGIDGALKNHIPLATRYICDGPVDPVEAEKELMFIDGQDGRPWKQRLWPYPVYPGHTKVDCILIHPDGGKGGTSGCIGTLTNAMDWYNWQADYWSKELPLVIQVDIGVIV